MNRCNTIEWKETRYKAWITGHTEEKIDVSFLRPLPSSICSAAAVPPMVTAPNDAAALDFAPVTA